MNAIPLTIERMCSFLKYGSYILFSDNPSKNINSDTCIYICMVSYNFDALPCTLCRIGNSYRDSAIAITFNDVV